MSFWGSAAFEEFPGLPMEGKPASKEDIEKIIDTIFDILEKKSEEKETKEK